MDELVDVAHQVAEWLDGHNGYSHGEMSMQLLKIGEEYGEVIEAWIGANSQNPRKGATHTLTDVEDELVDVLLTVLVSIIRVGPTPTSLRDALERGVEKYEQRLEEAGA